MTRNPNFKSVSVRGVDRYSRINTFYEAEIFLKKTFSRKPQASRILGVVDFKFR